MLRRTPLKRATKPLKRAPLKRGSGKGSKAFAKARKESVSTWKKKAWAVFSRYIRAKYGPACYTCGKEKKPDGNPTFLQGGHFISRSHNATFLYEDNVRPQCYYCNVRERGNIGEYAYRLKQELGNERFDALLALGRTYKQFTVQELKDIHAKYAPAPVDNSPLAPPENPV